MTRNKDILEDIVIKYIPYQEGSLDNSTMTTDTNEVTLTSKDMTDWETGSFNLNLTDTPISQITVRANISDDASDYEILIEQEGIDLGYPSAFTKNK